MNSAAAEMIVSTVPSKLHKEIRLVILTTRIDLHFYHLIRHAEIPSLCYVCNGIVYEFMSLGRNPDSLECFSFQYDYSQGYYYREDIS